MNIIITYNYNTLNFNMYQKQVRKQVFIFAKISIYVIRVAKYYFSALQKVTET